MLANLISVATGALIGLLGTVIAAITSGRDKRRELESNRDMQLDNFANVWRERYWKQREAVYLECLTYAGKMYRYFNDLFQETPDSARRDDEQSADELRIARESMAIDGALRIQVQAYCSDEFRTRIDDFSGSVQDLARNIIALDQDSDDDGLADLAHTFEILTSNYLQVIDQARTEFDNGHLYAPSSTLIDGGDQHGT